MNQKGITSAIFIIAVLVICGLVITSSFYFKNNLLTKTFPQTAENKTIFEKKDDSSVQNNNSFAKLAEELPIETDTTTNLVGNDNELTKLLRQKALDYLKAKPNITYVGITTTWDEFFFKSNLTRKTGKPLDYDWFATHKSEYGRTKDKNFMVVWTGLPGCEQDISKPGGIDNGPNYFDANGQRCYLLWSVTVTLDHNNNPIKVNISEVGGIS